ncbi:MAG: tRNA preQ1(34) S-adenosylmethionine ribosyltransferase-isomerase QueA [Gammaproteobacteria bacterium]|jgi:S-adenosylmethionine:tRNA ribosyltransferase-isomerase
MYTKDFDYQLPPKLIAAYPLKARSQSRLLCLNRNTGEINHAHFYQLLDLLQPNDCLILNNTKVIPARLFGQKETGGQVEILIERLKSMHEALVHIRASKSPKAGSEILLEQNIRLRVDEKLDDLYHVTLLSPQPFLEILDQIGHMPLPPYIERADEALDKEQYQTVYGHVPGAIAAPTAGLHFDEDLLTKIKAKGVKINEVTLHVGAGTFQPVRVENIHEHHMHSEWLEVSKDVCDLIQNTKRLGGRVVAVGTTVVRSLETAAFDGELKPFSGQTKLFIFPGFKFNVVDAMITNFHLPRSTLLMLVSAFAGREHILAAYQEAIDKRYRFFSYGDAMWIA